MATVVDGSSIRDWRLPVGGGIVAGALVAVLLGVYGRVHDPAGEATIQLFFSATLHFKAWATTVVALLAVAQIALALWLYGKLGGGHAPAWVGPTHRLTGTLVLLVSLPVAYHCLWSLGFDPGQSGGRPLLHSIVGCAFYGAYVTKVVFVHTSVLPAWALPTVGSIVFVAIVVVWLTSSLWFFQNVGIEI